MDFMRDGDIFVAIREAFRKKYDLKKYAVFTGEPRASKRRLRYNDW